MATATLARPVSRSPSFGQRLDAVIDRLPGNIGGVAAADFWRAVVRLQADTGLPTERLLRMHRSHIAYDAGTLTLPESGRVIELSRATLNALRAIDQPERTTMLPWIGGASALGRALNDLTAAAAAGPRKGGVA